MVLNAHSTLLMGRVGRFESNLMTFVVPVNLKLERRAVRLVQWLLEQSDSRSSTNGSARVQYSQEQVAEELRRVQCDIAIDVTARRSVVLEVVKRLGVRAMDN